jgi:hypothetical protein
MEGMAPGQMAAAPQTKPMKILRAMIFMRSS